MRAAPGDGRWEVSTARNGKTIRPLTTALLKAQLPDDCMPFMLNVSFIIHYHRPRAISFHGHLLMGSQKKLICLGHCRIFSYGDSTLEYFWATLYILRFVWVSHCFVPMWSACGSWHKRCSERKSHAARATPPFSIRSSISTLPTLPKINSGKKNANADVVMVMSIITSLDPKGHIRSSLLIRSIIYVTELG